MPPHSISHEEVSKEASSFFYEHFSLKCQHYLSQRKIPVVLRFLHHRHKAGLAAQPKGSAHYKGPQDHLSIVRYACFVPVAVGFVLTDTLISDNRLIVHDHRYLKVNISVTVLPKSPSNKSQNQIPPWHITVISCYGGLVGMIQFWSEVA